MERYNINSTDFECPNCPGFACTAPCPMANPDLRKKVEMDVTEPPSYKVSDQRGKTYDILIKEAIAANCTEDPSFISNIVNRIVSLLVSRTKR